MTSSLARGPARWLRMLSMAALGLAVGAGVGSARQVPGDPVPVDPQPPGSEVLARGPIHEAFAEPIVFDPTPGVAVPKPPPSTVIEELPPEQKPEGADVQWIPGYWSWDEERGDYIWISGIWRDIPPGRQWIPGYWAQVDAGSLWTPGFWASAAANGQFNYLPAPPASLENGPNAPAPGPDYSWVPGSWAWVEDRYAWRPGYWIQANPDWVWTPGSYCSTPSGYVYNEGYWDYSLERRGLAFAPVAFVPATLARPNYSYTPTYVLPASGLVTSLFIRPSRRQYYYGDYHQAATAGPRSGYIPWYGLQQDRIGYDPLYASMSALNRRDPDWDRRMRDDYRRRSEVRDDRPAVTIVEQRVRIEQRRSRGEDVRNTFVAQPFNQWAANRDAGRRFVPVAPDHRDEIARRQDQFRALGRDRALMERDGRDAGNNARPEDRRPHRLELQPALVTAVHDRRPPSPATVAPPPQPPAYQAFRPTFNQQPAVLRPALNPERLQPNPNRPRADDRPRPGDNRPGGDRPGDNRPNPDRPRPGQSNIGQPFPGQPLPGQPGFNPNRPGGDRPRPDQPGGDRPDPDRPRQQPLPGQPNIGQPGFNPNRPGGDRPRPGQPGGDRPDPDRPRQQPLPGQPNIGQPNIGQPLPGQPGFNPNRPGGDRPRPGQPRPPQPGAATGQPNIGQPLPGQPGPNRPGPGPDAKPDRPRPKGNPNRPQPGPGQPNPGPGPGLGLARPGFGQPGPIAGQGRPRPDRPDPRPRPNPGFGQALPALGQPGLGMAQPGFDPGRPRARPVANPERPRPEASPARGPQGPPGDQPVGRRDRGKPKPEKPR